MSEPRRIADSVIATVFRVRSGDGEAALKIFKPEGLRDEAGSALALRCFAGCGAVRLLQEAPDAQLLEYLEGPDLVSLVKRGEDDVATRVLAAVLREIHASVAVPPPELATLRDRYRSLLLFARETSNPLFAEGARIADILLRTPEGEVVLHGDLHHANILQSSRGWICIDPKGLRGERTFDSANALFNPVSMPSLVREPKRIERTARILSDELDIDFRRLVTFGFTYGCLSACWSLEDGGNADVTLKVAQELRRLMISA